MQHSHVLATIDPEYQRAIMADRHAHAPEECDGLCRMEVPDRRAREERDATYARCGGGKHERCGEIGAHGMHRETRIVFAQSVRYPLELLARDVDGHVRHRLVERIEEHANLDARAAAVLDERGSRAGKLRDLRGVSTQDLELRAWQIVLVERADALEERCPVLVVEQLRGKRLRFVQETAQHLAADAVVLDGLDDARLAEGGRLAGHGHERATRRMPVNCQRASDGKKLRYVKRACDGGVAQEAPRSTH